MGEFIRELVAEENTPEAVASRLAWGKQRLSDALCHQAADYSRALAVTRMTDQDIAEYTSALLVVGIFEDSPSPEEAILQTRAHAEKIVAGPMIDLQVAREYVGNAVYDNEWDTLIQQAIRH